ncbi:hypothetical protein K474DRAFT_173881 [Panus rudis PR-1116 ss-1]|nr:hypothetical protein K474DRAFT_173881 [Panus rudis PR-1116 ss-1]
MVITCVCRYWRELARRTPRLWSYICIAPSLSSQEVGALLAEQLNLSKQCEIDVVINDDFLYGGLCSETLQCTYMLLKEAHRIRSLHVRCPVDLSYKWNEPVLTAIRSHGYSSLQHLSLTALRSTSLRGAITKILEILRQSPHLVSLDVYDNHQQIADIIDFNAGMYGSIITLPHLTTLRLWGTVLFCSTLQSQLCLPNVNKLSLHWSTRCFFNDLDKAGAVASLKGLQNQSFLSPLTMRIVLDKQASYRIRTWSSLITDEDARKATDPTFEVIITDTAASVVGEDCDILLQRALVDILNEFLFNEVKSLSVTTRSTFPLSTLLGTFSRAPSLQSLCLTSWSLEEVCNLLTPVSSAEGNIAANANFPELTNLEFRSIDFGAGGVETNLTRTRATLRARSKAGSPIRGIVVRECPGLTVEAINSWVETIRDIDWSMDDAE